jgi:hypothetical protein
MYPTTYMPSHRRRRSGASPALAATPSLPEPVTRENTVLLFVDSQVGPTWELEFGSMRRRMADLAGAARRAGVPTVVSAFDPDDRGPVIPELVAANSAATVVLRTCSNAWNDDRVRAAVRVSGRRVVIVIGSATDLSVALCAMSVANDGLGAYAILESPGTPAQSGRWFGDRLVVTTCCLVAEAFEPRALRSTRDCGTPKSITRSSRISGRQSRLSDGAESFTRPDE